MLWKPKRIKNEKYLKWIRQQTCVNCGSQPPNDAAHMGTGGMGTKVSDYMTLPLCRKCHTEGEFSYHKLGSEEAFARANGLIIERKLFDMLGSYLEEEFDMHIGSPLMYSVQALITKIEDIRNE